MRWLMVSESTPYDAHGGTEIYVRRLSQALLARGFEVSWAHYSERESGITQKEANDDPIHYYHISSRRQVGGREQAWQIAPIGLDGFKDVLRQAKPDFVHFHGFGQNQSPEHFAAAKQAGAKVLLTYHSPGQSCPRWDLLYKGRDMCSGEIDIQKCTDCVLHRIGIPAPARSVLANVDTSWIARILPYRAQHPFVRRRGIIDYRNRWMQGMALPDRVLWHAAWVRDLLLRNEISEDRLLHLQLPPPEPRKEVSDNPGHRSDTRNFVFIGRLSDIKGVHILTEAVGLLPGNKKLQVQIVGAKGPDEYMRKIELECAKDPRLQLVPPVPPDRIPDLLRKADAVIVPSLWPETGPYTVLEALWEGTPVVGSDRAGIRELLDQCGGGVLFEAGNPKQLARLLMECDFHGMRRDPTNLQTNWRQSFDRQLIALLEVL
jgi:glycosyltransferase involved in cell wall biosynthesis